MVNDIYNIEEIESYIAQQMSIENRNVFDVGETDYRYGVDSYSNRTHSITVESDEHTFNVTNARMPRTRIFLTAIDNEYFDISIIQYFDVNWLLIKRYDPSAKIKVYFSEDLYADDKLFKIGDSLSPNEKNIVLLSQKGEFVKADNPYTLLKNICEHETKLNPIYYLRSRNDNQLAKIDRLWSGIDSISESGVIKTAKYFFWIQELFLHFNWIDKLTESYDQLADPMERNTLKKCRERLDIHLNKNKPNRNSSYDSLFSAYIYGGLSESNLLKMIEDVWFKIAYPARELYFTHELNKNPNEYLALLFLAIKNNLYWYPLLLDKIERNLHDRQLLEIVLLLSELKKHSNLYLDSGIYRFASAPYVGIKNSVKISSIPASFESYQSYGKYYTKFISSRNNIEFRVDKSVKLCYSSNKNEIKIQPNIYSALENVRFNEINLQIEKFRLIIPLVWDNFTVYINNSRIKFLLKKKRWQISFKKGKSVNSIFINNDRINFGDKKYFSIDYENRADGNRGYFRFYDEYGVPIRHFSKALKRYTLRGIGIKGNGILSETFNLFYNDSRRSVIVNTNQLLPFYIKNIFESVDFRISASKFNSISFNFKGESGLFYSIKKTPAQLLRFKFIILIDGYERPRELNNAVNLFYRNFGFYPLVKSLPETRLMKNKFYLLISKKNNHQEDSDLLISSIKHGSGAINILETDQSNIFQAILELITVI
jgi:hypothetical protein